MYIKKIGSLFTMCTIFSIAKTEIQYSLIYSLKNAGVEIHLLGVILGITSFWSGNPRSKE